MATHDYVIDNSTGANVRADINSVLQAILTNNSSSSAPSTTAAYMFWADTTSGTLKIRNSSDNAWVELLQLDGTLTLEDGSASTPALAFRDDLNTGIFSSAADTFNVATAGVERMELGATTIFNEDGADVDFRIEGDTNANLFYVDAGNDRVAIGTNSPTDLVHVKDTSIDVNLLLEATGSGKDARLKLLAHSSGVSQIQFGDSDDGNIGLMTYDHSDNSLAFRTNDAERMRIDSSGNVGIGIANPFAKLTVFGSGGQEARVAIEGESGADPYINFLANNTQHWSIGIDDSDSDKFKIAAHSALGTNDYFVVDTSGDTGIGTSTPNLTGYTSPVTSLGVTNNGYSVLELQGLQSSNGAVGVITGYNTSGNSRIATINWNRQGGNNYGSISFETANNGSLGERARITNDGLTFNGDTAAANALNDFETGTFTLALGGTWTSNPTSLAGGYVKIGRMVHIFANFAGGSKSSSTSGYFEGLPFATTNYGTGAVVDANVAGQGQCLFFNTDRIWMTDTSFNSTTYITGQYTTDA